MSLPADRGSPALKLKLEEIGAKSTARVAKVRLIFIGEDFNDPSRGSRDRDTRYWRLAVFRDFLSGTSRNSGFETNKILFVTA